MHVSIRYSLALQNVHEFYVDMNKHNNNSEIIKANTAIKPEFYKGNVIQRSLKRPAFARVRIASVGVASPAGCETMHRHSCTHKPKYLL